MKPTSLVLRIYGEKRDEQWSLICLDFNVAVQADSLNEAKDKLHNAVLSYLLDSLAGGADSEHAKYFLTRRAPLLFWVKYYFSKLIKRTPGDRNGAHVASSDTIPMIPVGA